MNQLMCLFLIFKSVLHFVKIKLFPGASFENIQNVLWQKISKVVLSKLTPISYHTGCLEMRSGVVGLGDEKLAACSILSGLKRITHLLLILNF